jgi:hypothetical protein
MAIKIGRLAATGQGKSQGARYEALNVKRGTDDPRCRGSQSEIRSTESGQLTSLRSAHGRAAAPDGGGRHSAGLAAGTTGGW